MSYTNSSGGTLTIPSPTNVHHVDMTAAVRSLRRSLSRSPSKFGLSRTSSHGSDSSLDSLHSPTPRSPCRPAPSKSNDATSSCSTPLLPSEANNSTPFKSSVKLSLRSARPKAASARPLSRTRVSPKSPLKRALNATPDAGTSTTPSISAPEALGQENNSFASFALGFSPSARKNLERPSRHSMHLDTTGSSKSMSSRFLEIKNEAFPISAVSPLKRSDATMDSDQASLGSPVAKRRSLHGVSSLSGPTEFNIFDHAPPAQPSFDIHEDPNQEYQLTGTAPLSIRDALPPPTPTAMPRRSSSLRKSTLQQRYGERSSWGRRQGEKHLAQLGTDISTPAPRNRPRVSLDQFIQPPPRDSPFSTQGPLPNPSLHLMERPAHPLSRTLTTSSSNSSVPDESPTHFPVQFEKPRTHSIFARSLPLNAQRPTEHGEKNMATPAYKAAKPFQDAFKSTGLVSKMNRNPEQEPSQFGGRKGLAMPDTPCKKSVYPSNTYPPQSGGSGKRHQRHSFGSPSTPFNPMASQSLGTFGNPDRVVGLFKIRPGHTRKASILSLDGDNSDSQNCTDGELPPTPTKSVLFRSFGSTKQSNQTPASRSPAAPVSAVGFGMTRRPSDPASSPLERLDGTGEESPKTPQEPMMPPDPSRLSISNPADFFVERKSSLPPATPTAKHDGHFGFADRRLSITPVNGQGPSDVDISLLSRFDKVDLVGKGEFSQVFKVVKSSSPRATPFAATPVKRTPRSPAEQRVYAVKKIRIPYQGSRDREMKLREVNALRALHGLDHVVQYVDSWEQHYHLYIQTEFCDEGTLDGFLKNVGLKGRLDDFRIWKILVELSEGVKNIHEAGFIHLDLKPANVLINYEGVLKIGDFGMATKLPATRGIEGEGDRQYIAPEILRGHFDKPADVFSLGLLILEMACNVFLPENGPTWVALREGDFSLVPTLAGSEATAVARDATGMPVENDSFISPIFTDGSGLSTSFNTRDNQQGFPFEFSANSMTHDASNLFGTPKRSELQHPPDFMVQPEHHNSLDSVVKWMLTPDPARRPAIENVLQVESILWVGARRRAGATVFEGNWGPQAQEESSFDTEMTDV